MPSESQRVDLIRIPSNELYATLEVLTSLGVPTKGFDLIRQDPDFAEAVGRLLRGTTNESRAKEILKERMVSSTQVSQEVKGVEDLRSQSSGVYSNELPWNELSLMTFPEGTFVFPFFPEYQLSLDQLLYLIARKPGYQTVIDDSRSRIDQNLCRWFRNNAVYYGWSAIKYHHRCLPSVSGISDLRRQMSLKYNSCLINNKNFELASLIEVIFADVFFFLVYEERLHENPVFLPFSDPSGYLDVVSVAWGISNSYEINVLIADTLDFEELNIAVPLVRKRDKLSR